MPSANFDIPILLIMFNRLETVMEVFGRIRDMRPKELFIAADGPRESRKSESALCQAVRKRVLESIDWPCEVKTLFQEKNLGCKYAVSGAIRWFFQNVEMGIVLEDDCLPSPSFFDFCRVLLVAYKDDARIGMISGHNYFGRTFEKDADYSLITTCGVWGWASWKRALSGYDPDQCSLTTAGRNTARTICLIKEAENALLNYSLAASRSEIDTWDYQFCDHLISNGMYTIMPSLNLIRNLGFSEQSTHTQSPPTWYRDAIYEYQVPIRFSENLKVNKEIAKKIERFHAPSRPSVLSRMIAFARRIKRLLRLCGQMWHDLRISVLRGLDGDLGERLRRRHYARLGMRLGKDVRIDTGVFIYGPEHISIGDRTHIDKNCILVGAPNDLDLSQRILKERSYECPEIARGTISIGKDCHISQNCMIYGYGGVLIGDSCVLSTGAKIYSLTSMPSNPFDPGEIVSIVPYEGKSPTLIGKVVLRNNVWVGIDSVISPGLEIGSDSFVRSNSIVMKSFDANSYIAGDPAVFIRHRYASVE